ncbi:hypothetical protein BDW02DRAFT_640645 [Decorospora gaudefroyi]|uniref:HAD-like protein n=1 Tax=Decorospora gaudefroyi TaxID=184978 RepID=A0A6A5KCC6_9PLEO|nr:hypothetical protein BDW02DRAFT_640645 [Decorospora gaudefroyi]
MVGFLNCAKGYHCYDCGIPPIPRRANPSHVTVIHVFFDKVGPLISYDHFHTVLHQRLGPSLQPHITSASLLGFAWLESAERKYTNLFLSGVYIPFVTKKSEVRFGAKECIDRLRGAGWTVWAFTSADRERVMGYFERGGVDIFTCDDIGVRKPEVRAYEKVKERVGARGDGKFAAGKAGFQTAYCAVLEKEPLEEVFGKMDVVADTLPELAERLVGVVEDGNA